MAVQADRIPGSKWWKVDFHVHTPASGDYKKPDATEKELLMAAMVATIDCIIISDHNSGEWISRLKTKNDELKNRQPLQDWYREITIFPGVEITVADSASRIHLLAVFDPSCDSAKITAVLGACGISSDFGNSDRSTSKGFLDVVKTIKEHDGIAIPAHIDGQQGLLYGITTLNQETKNSLDSIFAAEFCELSAFAASDVQLKNAVDSLAKVGGSDAHEPDKIGQHFTWIKMGTPSIEGLRLALQDHAYCVKNQPADPNCLPGIWIKKLTVANMKYCGRVSPLELSLHPHFNAIIGGRGTGKSTLLESMRFAARRDYGLETESPNTKKLIDDLVESVTLDNAEILMEIHRHSEKYRLRWRRDGTGAALEKQDAGTWTETEEGEIPERFPVAIFSQKQIFELAAHSRGLLDIIDRAPQVNRPEWNTQWRDAKSRFLQTREHLRELEGRITDETKLRTALSDVENDLRQYEEKGHGAILKEYQHRTQQESALPGQSFFDEASSRLHTILDAFDFPEFPSHLFPPDDATTEKMQKIHETAAASLGSLKQQVQGIIAEIAKIRDTHLAAIANSDWHTQVQAAKDAYEGLVKEYAAKQSPLTLAVYGEWVQKRNALQQQLAGIEATKKEVELVRQQDKQEFIKLLELRTKLSTKRRDFLKEILSGNPHVRIELVSMGDTSDIEESYCEVLNIQTGFQSTIYDSDNHQGILWKLTQRRDEESLSVALSTVKKNTFEIAAGRKHSRADKRFDDRLRKLKTDRPAVFDELDAWFPEDLLSVKYSQNNNGGSFKDIIGGSPGQKSAAILAFLLSYGDGPLIIDQPEDDLDNALIYELIVTAIQKNKERRQLIIVTHNPNIVVNGDAELVHALEVTNGQTSLMCQGGLEEQKVRDAVCRIMEGGEEAFDKRYKRIMPNRKNYHV